MNDYISYTIENNPNAVINFINETGYPITDDLESCVLDIISSDSETIVKFLELHPDYEVIKEIVVDDFLKKSQPVKNAMDLSLNTIKTKVEENDILKYGLFIFVAILLIKIIN